MVLWNRVLSHQYSAVVGDLPSRIIDIWQEEIMRRFTGSKKAGSFGPVDDPAAIIKSASIIMQKPYRNPVYVEEYPNTYYKTGNLSNEMLNDGTYMFTFGNEGFSVTVTIPDFLGDKDAYRDLESKRSFIKSSFILAWPKIVNEIMRSIIYG